MPALRRQMLSPVTQFVWSTLGFALAVALANPLLGLVILAPLLLSRVTLGWPRPEVEDRVVADASTGPRPAASSREAEDVEAARLVLAYRAGDRSAFDALHSRYYGSVLACARVTVRPADDPEYVARRVFMRVSAALGRLELRRDLPFRLWLFRLARRTMLEARTAHLRARQPARTAHRARAASLPLTEDVPPSEYAALSLARALDLSADDLATELGRSPDQVCELLAQGVPGFEEARRGRGSTERWQMVAYNRRAPVLSARRMALQSGVAAPVIGPR